MSYTGTVATTRKTQAPRSFAPHNNVATIVRPVSDGQATAPAPPPPQPVKQALELVMYSDRSFAIFGDTKPVKDQLHALYGKFNRYLKRNGGTEPGYIFSIGRLDSVKKALNLY